MKPIARNIWAVTQCLRPFEWSLRTYVYYNDNFN